MTAQTQLATVQMDLRKQELLEARFLQSGASNGVSQSMQPDLCGSQSPAGSSQSTRQRPDNALVNCEQADSPSGARSSPAARKRRHAKRIDDYLRSGCQSSSASASKEAGTDDSSCSSASCEDFPRQKQQPQQQQQQQQSSKRKKCATKPEAKLSPIKENHLLSTAAASPAAAALDSGDSNNRFVQTDQQMADTDSTNSELLLLQKTKEELSRQLAVQKSLVANLQAGQDRGCSVLRSLLLEKAQSDREAVRRRCRENQLRLGHFQIVRHGAQLEDKWFDGSAFQELARRRQEVEAEKERIEKEKRMWNRRKPANRRVGAAGGISNAAAASSSAGAATKQQPQQQQQQQQQQPIELEADEFFTQLEVYDIKRQALLKDERDLRDELELLNRERNVHIRETKRIQNEDASRFNDNPTLHDRYLLLTLLGKGGFSEVHKAYDFTEHRYVACKIHQLNSAWPKEKKDNYIRHAVREIDIHKTLQHSRIVKVFDVFDIDSDCFCTVLEYSRGCDLDFYLKQNKSLVEREARNVICQVVSALKYLNQRKPPVIHYDLKPGNILLENSDCPAAVKLTDFGLSKVMTDEAFHPDSGMELTCQGAGTYWYLPPECFETGPEKPKISSKVDVWSVGVIFFQCLYGQKPFGHNMSQSDILRNRTILKAQQVEFPQSGPGNAKVSEQAKNFIRRCVTYDKHYRPDVLQLAEDEYLKSKAQLKYDTSSAAAAAGSGSSCASLISSSLATL